MQCAYAAIYNVPVVVAEIMIPLRSIVEALLQTVGSTYWGAQRAEELLMNPTQKMVYSAGNGEVEVAMRIPEQWNGHTLGELLSPSRIAFRSDREPAARCRT
jgi:hypothetical protein